MWIKKTGWTFLYAFKEVQFTAKVQWAGLLKGFQLFIRFAGRENYRESPVSRARKQLYTFEEKKCSEQVYLKVLEAHVN